ncbi:uncharacterized protein LOC112488686 [Cynoglossus semilaevis]|uniref:Uncharacterized LOC112488686 n=1 Tax=Cynoglossus semilaevis TaxID=244447 RepID=A0A3P8W6H3_CYNSE|nr:uncharacterized protein LOC112488686 [Cynoglossus semilaevis]
MSLNPVLGSFFCLIAWISLAHAIQGHTSNCCLRLSKTRVPVENIRNYTIQSSGLCSIGAVVFLTKKGKTICSDPGSLWTKKAMLKVDEEMRSLEEARRSQQVVTSDITPAPLTEAEVGLSSDPREERVTKATLRGEEVTQRPQEERQSEQMTTSDITPAARTEAEGGLSSDPREERVTKATLRGEEVTQRPQEERQSEQMTTSDITPAARTEAEVARGVTSDPKKEHSTKAVLKVEEVTKSPQEVRQSEQVTTGDVTPAAVKNDKVGKRTRSDPKKERSTKAVLKVEEVTKSQQEARQSEQVTTGDVTPAARTEAEVVRGVTSDPKKEFSTKAMVKVEEVTKSPQEVRQSEQVTTGDVMPTAVKMVRRKRPWRKARRVKRRQKCKNVRKQQMSRF